MPDRTQLAVKYMWFERAKLAIRTLLQPARREQVAALCYQQTKSGKRVLLVTSRDTGRWIVPKGWPIQGLSNPDAALREAWEEAGVKTACITETPIGSYAYDKELNNGETAPVRAQVFAAEVTSLKESYPEANQRKRRWFSPKEAAKRVREPALKALLNDF